MKNKLLRVWHCPQVPCKAFTVMVKDIALAKFLLDALANYDLFQLNENIKGDYSNAGGLCEFDEKIAERIFNKTELAIKQTYGQYKEANPKYYEQDIFKDAWVEWYDEDGLDVDEHFENLEKPAEKINSSDIEQEDDE